MHKSDMIALCFLVVGKLNNMERWKQWLSDDDKGEVMLYFHVSRPSDSVFMAWAAQVGSIIPEITTRWGHRSLLDAELALYETAFAGSLTDHCMLVTETDLPVVTLERALKVCRALKKRSTIEIVHVQMRESGWISSSAFKILSRSCFDGVSRREVELLTQDVQLLVDSGCVGIAADEIVLSTIMMNTMSSQLVTCRTTIATHHNGFPCCKCSDRTDYCMHAKVMRLLQNAVKFIKKEKRAHRRSIFARKFVDEISAEDFEGLVKA